MIGRKKVSAMPRGRHRKGRSGGVARRKGSVRGWGGGGNDKRAFVWTDA